MNLNRAEPIGPKALVIKPIAKSVLDRIFGRLWIPNQTDPLGCIIENYAVSDYVVSVHA